MRKTYGYFSFSYCYCYNRGIMKIGMFFFVIRYLFISVIVYCELIYIKARIYYNVINVFFW